MLAQHYGSLCWAINIGVYDNTDIERHLIGRAATEMGVDVQSKEPVHDTLHIISEPLVTGGHTRLMEKLASMHDSRPDVLISRGGSLKAIEKVSCYFERVHQVRDLPVLERVRSMVKIIAGYQRIVLHIHPDDILAVVACGIDRNRGRGTYYFVNHADHGFSYGSTIADVYFELSSYGRRVDEHKNIIGKKAFLGIPVSLPKGEVDVYKQQAHHDDLVFLTAGSDIKFKPRKGEDIRPLVEQLLRAYPKSKMIVLGANPLTNMWWWKIKLEFRKRISIVGHLPYEQYSEVVKRADYYIDSHPFPGGTAFAEQLLAGRRCIGLVSPFQGYSPADKAKCNGVADVIHKVASYNVDGSLLEQVIKVNGYQHVKNRYISCLYEGRVSPNLMDEYSRWTGDITFMQIEESGCTADVPVGAFLEMRVIKPGLARAVFSSLGMAKRMKLLLKIGVFMVSNHLRSSPVSH
jgi:hypothetical protein